MMARRAFTFTTTPAGEIYRNLLAAGGDAASEFCLMMQHRKHFSTRCIRVLHRLEPLLERTEEVSAWPGSELHSSYSSTRYVYKVSEELQSFLGETADSLSEWVNPELPEDPHFLRADGTTWLGSTTQEEDAWLELTEAEWAELSKHWPRLAATLRPDEPRG